MQFILLIIIIIIIMIIIIIIITIIIIIIIILIITIINTSAPISNLFYMDDLKLYSKNEQEQVGELKIVKQFSDDIGMEFGLEKCAKASFKRGKLASTGNIVIDDDTEIQELDQEGVYKYLGVDESDGIQHSKMKEKIRKEYNRRVRLILRTELN